LREDNDIYFRVTKEPEQVLVEDRATAFVGKGLAGFGEEDLGEIEAVPP